MDAEPTGGESADPAESDSAEEAPLIRIGGSELRTGKWLLAVGIAAVVFGVVMLVLAILRPHSIFDSLLVISVSGAGTMLVLGTQKFRNGRATVRDELQRQAESPPVGRAGESE